MTWTHDCSQTISGEHFISETVLSILNPRALRISGAAFIPKGETKDLPLTALRANVLCTRHNSAWSPLDTMAGEFFRALPRYTMTWGTNERCRGNESGASSAARNWSFGS
jgi:hypothetical protein